MKKIKILKCEDGESWYRNKIGEKYDLIDTTLNYFKVGNSEYKGTVLKDDAEVVQEEICTFSLLQDELARQKKEIANNFMVKNQVIPDFPFLLKATNNVGNASSTGTKKVVYTTKQTEGKLFYELDFEFITMMAQRMAKNKSKGYQRFGWKQGVDLEEIKMAGWRHTLSIMNGEYSDDGDEYGHFVAQAVNAMIAVHELKRRKLIS